MIALSKASPGMTLVRVLAVVSIVGFLALLIFFAVNELRGYAPRLIAKQDATELAAALTAYRDEYGTFPEQRPGNINSADLLNVLDGAKGEDGSNPRKIQFMYVARANHHKNGAEVDDDQRFVSPYLDSWGNPYEVRIDKLAGTAGHESVVESPDGMVRKSVIVWSRGNPEKASYNDPTKWIKSWE